MKRLQKFVDEEIQKMNKSPRAEFEGYSPNEMDLIINHPLDTSSPIQLVNDNSSDYQAIPLFNQVKFLFDLVEEQGELKLTAAGFLSPKLVVDLYGKGYIKDYLIEKGISKLYREEGVDSIQLARILLELSSFTKKRKNIISLTKEGARQIANDQLLFLDIFQNFTRKFNWSYFDSYQNQTIGQVGFGYSLILLAKYGDEYRSPNFYATKYLTAFPPQKQTNNPVLAFAQDPKNCYSIRTFDRFLDYVGFTEISKVDYSKLGERKVRKTELFDTIIKVSAPKGK